VPDLRILWYVYEVNLPAANANCWARGDDPEGHIAINKRWASHMTAPDGAIVLRIHTESRQSMARPTVRLVAAEKKRRRRSVVDRLVGQ
jgi:hypothetical protein